MLTNLWNDLAKIQYRICQEARRFLCKILEKGIFEGLSIIESLSNKQWNISLAYTARRPSSHHPNSHHKHPDRRLESYSLRRMTLERLWTWGTNGCHWEVWIRDGRSGRGAWWLSFCFCICFFIIKFIVV